jgi:hypothetical protein
MAVEPPALVAPADADLPNSSLAPFSDEEYESDHQLDGDDGDDDDEEEEVSQETEDIDDGEEEESKHELLS